MLLEAKQEERKGERNLSEDTSQNSQLCEKATPSKTTEKNSWGTNNAKKPKYRFSRKTGKKRQNQWKI